MLAPPLTLTLNVVPLAGITAGSARFPPTVPLDWGKRGVYGTGSAGIPSRSSWMRLDASFTT